MIFWWFNHVHIPNFLEIIPSGKLTFCYGKSPFFMGTSTISMAIFNSYVKLPEGKSHYIPWNITINYHSITIFWKSYPPFFGARSGACKGSIAASRAFSSWLARRDAWPGGSPAPGGSDGIHPVAANYGWLIRLLYTH